MKKSDKIIYWIATGLLSVNMLFSAAMYFFNYEMVAGMIEKLQYPTYIIYPLGIAKLLGIGAIVSNKSKGLKEWAYAGFFFELLLAASAHININDGEALPAIIALVLLIVSYIFNKRIEKAKAQ